MKIDTLLLIISAIFLSLVVDMGCVKCSKNMKIVDKTNDTFKINLLKTRMTTIEYDKNIKVAYTSRSMYNMYCYDGGPADSNTGCEEHYNPIPVTQSEFPEWHKRKQCRIGHVCRPDGDCWGSDADKCKDKDTFKWVDKSSLKWISQRYLFFSHHTCTMSWECSYKEFEVESFVLSENGAPLLHIPLLNGTPYPVSRAHGLSIDDYKGETIFLPDETIRSKYYESEATCVNSEGETRCIITKPDNLKNIPVSLYGDQLCGTYKNLWFCANDCIEGENQTPCPKGKNNSDKINHEFNPSSAHSMKEAFKELKLSLIQSHYNSITLYKDIIDLKNVLLHVINSVSKRDKRLIGKIIGDLNTRTNWINDEYFQLCENKKVIFGGSNCAEGYMYNVMGLTPISETDRPCTAIDEDKVINVELFHFKQLFLDNIKEYAVETDSEHMDGWIEINEKDHHTFDNLPDQDISEGSHFGSADIPSWLRIFTYLGPINTIVCVIIIILLIRK